MQCYLLVSFDLRVPNDAERFFICALSLEEILLKFFCHFEIGLFAFFFAALQMFFV